MQIQVVPGSARLIYQPDPSRKKSMLNETPTAVDPEDVATKTLITMLTVMKMNQQSTPAIHKSPQSQEESKRSAAPGLTQVLNGCPPSQQSSSFGLSLSPGSRVFPRHWLLGILEQGASRGLVSKRSHSKAFAPAPGLIALDWQGDSPKKAKESSAPMRQGWRNIWERGKGQARRDREQAT